MQTRRNQVTKLVSGFHDYPSAEGLQEMVNLIHHALLPTQAV